MPPASRRPSLERQAPERPAAFALLHESGLFDAEYYAAQGAAPPGADPLVHFCTMGWRSGRKPNPYFDPAFYLETNPDVAAAGLNPLLHYIEFGDSEGRNPSAWFHTGWYRREHGVPDAENALAHFLARRHRGQVSPVPLFDPAWYLETNPDVAAAGTDPFAHFLNFGETEDRDPSPDFDIRFYRTRYAAELRGQNPLLHYLANRDRGFHPRRPDYERLIAGGIRAATRPAPEFEEVQRLPEGSSRRAMLLAYYLPQFHPTPENDAWWGKGFTDWTNLARATPRFAGHYQPRIPRDLGFYSLDDPRILPRQIDMAKGAGIGGFVFYYYWFNRKRLLEAPLERFLANAALDFPFCLMWANENWTRRWDGLDREVLLAQEYDEADDAALIDDLARHFKDPRYIRLEGRPLLMIYRAALIPDSKATIARWRALFAERHGENPLIFMAQSFHDNDPTAHGLDGAVEFPPHKLVVDAPKLNGGLDLFDPEFTAAVHRYDDIAAASLGMPKPDYPLIRTIVPGWDNDPRREGKGLVLHESSPLAYQTWLEALIGQARENPVSGTPLLCVNAWNEWAEGAYLEPDVHYGAAFLNATARAVSGQTAADAARHLLLVGHDALVHGSQLLLLHLARELRREHGIEPHILLLAGGPLAAEYAKAGDLRIAAGEASRKALIARYRRLGIGAAIVNTAASASLCEELAAAGIAATLLIHEMPRLIREKSLAGALKRGMAAAQEVVF
ncbi:MAG TPA: glycoside hydrolase family 99-like domain-containing protein, partial [Acetobacteraceae bacterium]|nr:glycoside hydrolase family 99-like domain-containing protein [Acetobacteraceae bacterium]